ncbi:hypothetical protein ABQF26_04615 [Mycolicibacterium elephantis]
MYQPSHKRGGHPEDDDFGVAPDDPVRLSEIIGLKRTARQSTPADLVADGQEMWESWKANARKHISPQVCVHLAEMGFTDTAIGLLRARGDL